MRYLVSVATICVVAGCASSTSNPVPPGRETVTRVFVPGGGGPQMMFNEPGVGARHMDFPLDSVWRVLPRVYQELGVPEAGEDRTRKIYGNLQFRPRRIEGKRLSSYLDCGMGTTAVPNADDWQVTMSLVTELLPEDDGTMVVTTMDATAKPRATNGNPIHCQSKGVLEARVATLILLAVLGGE